jgi:hypothetical protein
MRAALSCLIAGLTLAPLCHPADADLPTDQTWACRSGDTFVPSGSSVIIRAKRFSEPSRGSVKVDNIERPASFSYRGLDKRWDFGLNDKDTYDYAVIIFPDGMGAYYDFSATSPTTIVKPSLVLRCSPEPLSE